MYYNRNMGNVEYDQTLHLPPAAYQITTDVNNGSTYGGGVGLNYDTAAQATLANRISGLGINTLTNGSFTFPQNHSFSVSYARRIGFDQVIEAAYVGTRGRHLVTHVNGNAVPEGALLQGAIGNANLSDPVQRWALDGAAINQFRPYQAYPTITVYDFEGTSNYNSMQLTLSRQTGKHLQYFATYTLSRTEGTLGDEYRLRDPFVASRTYGIRNEDRTHIFNLSWNAFLPDPIKSGGNLVAKGFLNGWQISGISTVASGIPIWLGFSGPAGSTQASQTYYGTPDTVLLTGPGSSQSGIAPVYTCNPVTGNTSHGEKLLDISCVGFPAFGQEGQVKAPYNLRTPTRFNHDITFFKNFAVTEQQKLQVRVGIFNIFNNAFASTGQVGDITLSLNTVCNATVDNVPNGVGGTANGVCDATKGFHYDSDTLANFGKINLLRGHRVVEFALKYYF
jgi:hypothetical protein